MWSDASVLAIAQADRGTLHVSALQQLSGDRALRESAVQSLFTHFSAVGGLSRLGGNKSSLSVNANANANANSDARSVRSFAGTLADPLLKGVVSSNVAHAVGALAVAFNDQELARLVASMLLQRLPVSGGGDSMVDGAVMYALAQIVSLLDDRTFEDVVKRVYDVSKGVPSESDLSSVVSYKLDAGRVERYSVRTSAAQGTDALYGLHRS